MPADDLSQQWQAASARAASEARDCPISRQIANERQAVVVQVGHDDVAFLTVCRGTTIVVDDFDDQMFGRQMKSLVTIALGAHQHELARAVRLEHRRAEHALDPLSLKIVQFLRADDDRLRRERLLPVFFQPAGERVERIGVGDQHVRPAAVVALEKQRHRRVAQVERIEHVPAVEPALVSVVLPLLAARPFSECYSPEIDLSRSRLGAGPGVTAMPGRHPPIVAVLVQTELEGRAARPARRLGDQPLTG